MSGAIETQEYLNIIENKGFINLKVHKLRKIDLPDSILSVYVNREEMNSIIAENKGIFSITISAEKP